MKPHEFTNDVCTRLLYLYKREFGGSRLQEYLEFPEIMAEHVQRPDSWLMNIEYYRIGSQWSDDTKLGFTLDDAGDLEVTAYLNCKLSNKRMMEKAETAEKSFIRSANSLLRAQNQ